MKKIAIAFALTSALVLGGCGQKTDSGKDESKPQTTENVADTEKSEGVMTYQEYKDAAIGDEVTVEAYVQNHQGWWDDKGQGKVTIYLADADGAYFVFEAKMDEEEAEKLVPGTKVKVTGVKSEWSGEIEIGADEMGNGPTVEFEDGYYVAEALDVTDLLGKDELIDHQNQYVAFKGVTIEAANDNGDAYMYNWDGSGTQGDDLYFKASINDTTYTFTVESYLTGKDTDVYKTVEGLKVGDVVDLEGFLYWYEGANPHITSVTVK